MALFNTFLSKNQITAQYFHTKSCHNGCKRSNTADRVCSFLKTGLKTGRFLQLCGRVILISLTRNTIINKEKVVDICER